LRSIRHEELTQTSNASILDKLHARGPAITKQSWLEAVKTAAVVRAYASTRALAHTCVCVHASMHAHHPHDMHCMTHAHACTHTKYVCAGGKCRQA